MTCVMVVLCFYEAIRLAEMQQLIRRTDFDGNTKLHWHKGPMGALLYVLSVWQLKTW